jgi:hypothetical protein
MDDQLKLTLRKFTELIESKENVLSQDALEDKLTSILDEIAHLRHLVRYEFDETDYSEFEGIGEQFRAEIEKKFKDVGYYNSLEHVSTNLLQTAVLAGDAIDDILDIYKDLKEVLWRWENTSRNDAVWFFQDSFQGHWGRHLRDLQLYLHCKVRGE